MTAESAEELVGRLYGLLIVVEDRLGPERAREAYHFIEVGEYALALEEIAGVLGQVRAAITDRERDDMLALGIEATVRELRHKHPPRGSVWTVHELRQSALPTSLRSPM